MPALAAAVLAGELTLAAFYDFDRPSTTGSDALEVFEDKGSRVRRVRAAGHGHAVELRDVRGDGEFPELRVHIPERRAGRVLLRFAFATATPREAFRIALAGRGGYFFAEHGSAAMFGSEDGQLVHWPGGQKEVLLPLRAHRWSRVQILYDVDQGSYDLEVGEGPARVVRTGCRNGPGRPGSWVNNVSFIGAYDDSSAATYRIDDVQVSVDGPGFRPFVAPGRRRLHLEMWTEYTRFEAGRASCPQVADPSAAPEWSEGCARLQKRDYPGARKAFTRALERKPSSALFNLGLSFVDAAYGQADQARARIQPFVGVLGADAETAYWLALAADEPMVRARTIARLRPSVEAALGDPRPLEDLPAFERYHELLTWAGEPEAFDFAQRVLARLHTAQRPPGAWLERAGDGAFVANRWDDARRLYLEAFQADPSTSLRAKLSDVAFRVGDLGEEKRWREEIYGTVR